MPLTTFLVNNYSLLHRPVLIFQPTVNSKASDSQSKQCQNHISQLGKIHIYCNANLNESGVSSTKSCSDRRY